MFAAETMWEENENVARLYDSQARSYKCKIKMKTKRKWKTK